MTSWVARECHKRGRTGSVSSRIHTSFPMSGTRTRAAYASVYEKLEVQMCEELQSWQELRLRVADRHHAGRYGRRAHITDQHVDHVSFLRGKEDL